MEKPCLLSVVIPVYSSEPYIARCVKSLMEQSMEDGIEFIFVNDCSPDRTMDILRSVIQEYPHRLSQIQIIDHEQNLGAVQSRKDGALISKGEYIICCDHDDYIESNMYERLYQTTEGGTADIVECGFYRYKGEEKVGVYLPDKSNRLDLWNSYLWNHLVKRELFLAHYDDFIPCKYSEDTFLMCYYYYYASKIKVLRKALYHHIDNPESITHSMDIASIKHQLQANCSNVEKLYRSFAVSKSLHKYILHLKYQAKDSYSSLWSFYWSFRKSSFYILFDNQIPFISKMKMFLVNNIYVFFYIREKTK